MDHDRHCIEIVTQTELLTAALQNEDLRASVPSCPGWTLTRPSAERSAPPGHTGVLHRTS